MNERIDRLKKTVRLYILLAVLYFAGVAVYFGINVMLMNSPDQHPNLIAVLNFAMLILGLCGIAASMLSAIVIPAKVLRLDTNKKRK